MCDAFKTALVPWVQKNKDEEYVLFTQEGKRCIKRKEMGEDVWKVLFQEENRFEIQM